MIPALAFLDHDGRIRQVCLGCSEILLGLGMLRIKEERPMKVMNAEPGTYSDVLYEVVPPHTLSECQMTVLNRHKGGVWGE